MKLESGVWRSHAFAEGDMSRLSISNVLVRSYGVIDAGSTFGLGWMEPELCSSRLRVVHSCCWVHLRSLAACIRARIHACHRRSVIYFFVCKTPIDPKNPKDKKELELKISVEDNH